MRPCTICGFAHSFEVWSADGRLIGGGYGIAIGRVFYTESQFSRESNTSKMGFASLNHHLAKWGFVLNDGKDFTPTLGRDGLPHHPARRVRSRAARARHIRRARRRVEGRSRPRDHRRLNARVAFTASTMPAAVSTFAEYQPTYHISQKPT